MKGRKKMDYQDFMNQQESTQDDSILENISNIPPQTGAIIALISAVLFGIYNVMQYVIWSTLNPLINAIINTVVWDILTID